MAAPDRVKQLELDVDDDTVADTSRYSLAKEMVDSIEVGGELHGLLEIRVADLIGYQNRDYAREYLEFVRVVCDEERKRVGTTSTDVSEAVARHLHKLMTYKDEYEVARLHLDAAQLAKLRSEFGADAKVSFHLHPPVLRALGLKRKLKLGSWFIPAFRALRALRWLRRTPVDPFGFARVRRLERELIPEYRALVEAAVKRLTAQNHRTVVELCQLPDMIRGYEQIKLASVERFRERAGHLVAQLDGSQMNGQGRALWSGGKRSRD